MTFINKVKNLFYSILPIFTDTETTDNLRQKRRLETLHSVKSLMVVYSKNSHNLNYNKAQYIKVKCCKPNLVELVDHLSNINDCLMKDIKLSPSDFQCEVEEYLLIDLLKNNEYFIHDSYIESLCHNGILLCQLLETGDEVNDGLMNYHCLMLVRQLASIRDISNAIYHCY